MQFSHGYNFFARGTCIRCMPDAKEPGCPLDFVMFLVSSLFPPPAQRSATPKLLGSLMSLSQFCLGYNLPVRYCPAGCQAQASVGACSLRKIDSQAQGFANRL